MARFFNHFPKTYYLTSKNNSGLDTVTNIIARFSFEEEFKENTSAFYEYNIKEDDTPEIIASKYYNSIEKHWIVLLFNNIIDPQFDWPLEGRTLIEYIDKKYTDNGTANLTPQTGIQWAKNENNIHSYYKVIKTTSNYDGSVVTDKYQITSEEYVNTAISSTTYTLQSGQTVTEDITKEKMTYYDYENAENEKKRTIKLLKPEFIPAVEKEFKKAVKT